MRDMTDIIQALKKATVAAVESKKPVKFLYGEVLNAAPLTIRVDQKLILEGDQLILTDNVKDYDVGITVDHATESTSGGSGYDSFSSHSHAIKGRKTIRVHNSLKKGERVMLLRQEGGQQFIVLNRA